MTHRFDEISEEISDDLIFNSLIFNIYLAFNYVIKHTPSFGNRLMIVSMIFSSHLQTKILLNSPQDCRIAVFQEMLWF